MANKQRNQLPTLVFIPGSWHKPSCYDKVIALLRDEHGVRCEKVTLPSTQDNPEAGIKDDIDAAREVILKEMDAGRDVVVVAHSYGKKCPCQTKALPLYGVYVRHSIRALWHDSTILKCD
jgi:hypothetical protein